MAVIYKTVLDVKILHEFYLTNRDGKTIFEVPDQPGRKTFLEAQYARGAASISNDLSFEFPDSLRDLYDSYFLKVLPSYSGFRVLTRVNKKILSNGTLVYQPLVSLPGKLAIHILLTKKTTAIDHYTSARIRRPLPATFFFTNQDINGVKTFPFLTNRIPDRQANYMYEQGELASFSDTDTRAFYANAAGEQWYPMPGRGYASEADRYLLPSRFQYSFPEGTDVKEASFALKDPAGNTIKTITTSSPERLVKFPLDFTAQVRPGISGDMAITGQSFFMLEVNGNGYLRSHPVLLSDIFYNQATWGVVTLVPEPGNPDFNLLASDGYLFKRDTLTEKIPPPLYEIPVTSRYAYWRYTNDRKKNILDNNAFDGYLEKIDGRWTTIHPKAISVSGNKLRNVDGITSRYFPNPTSFSVDRDEEGRLFFDVTVPKSSLFNV